MSVPSAERSISVLRDNAMGMMFCPSAMFVSGAKGGVWRAQ
ncbi:hypothetical protein EM6_3301 (plasmid) [Asticcacaulis excentricus]|uniref:Uncharacterized protein n=1 Tax=Asticcacaulis excentricus TaxID=78587 RepID=A0A3G9G5X2_9CAUL|nr:hypothetical protein EM6_3301 [Asticcacaulis excentricus]